MTPGDRAMRESTVIEEDKRNLENRKPKLDKQVEDLKPLHSTIKDKLKSAFEQAKEISDIRAYTDTSLDPRARRLTVSSYERNFKRITKEVDKKMIDEYKPKRHALLGDINSLNEDIRRHNREISTKQRQGQRFSDNLKVDEYNK